MAFPFYPQERTSWGYPAIEALARQLELADEERQTLLRERVADCLFKPCVLGPHLRIVLIDGEELAKLMVQ